MFPQLLFLLALKSFNYAEAQALRIGNEILV